MLSSRSLLLLAAFAIVGCNTEKDGELTEETDTTPAPDLVAGQFMAGAAEGTLKLPAGTPLAGFTSRCSCMGSTSKQDDRKSAYVDEFVSSVGVHVRPTIKVVWLSNGDRNLVMTKTDQIYSFDGLVDDITHRLEELTGESLDGMVTHSTNHNHSSYGTFSQHIGLFLGHDRFNRENYEREVQQIVDVAMEAYNNRQPASIGLGIANNWDPSDRVYSDRRAENDDLVIFPDMGPEQGGKDQRLNVFRIDAAEGDKAPIAIIMNWGMHPYVFGEDSPLATGDASALVETEVAESFDKPVVAMFLNGSAGDASVRGSDDGYARMETVGIYARDTILDLWSKTKTSTTPIMMESVARSIPMNHDAVKVTRGGTVDFRYTPYSADPNYEPDNKIYADDGSLLMPIDEFNTEFGAVFCGSGGFPIGKLPGTTAWPYNQCTQVSFMNSLVTAFFELSEEESALPLKGMAQTYALAARIRQIPIHEADGTDTVDDVLLGFIPGEPLHFLNEMFRRRATEIGYKHDHAIMVGYSMDHEGYLTIPEDWLLGAYESDITFQGPLAAEYIMESIIGMADEVLSTDKAERFDPNRGPFQGYINPPLPTLKPDVTPEAGTQLTQATLPDYLWTPKGFVLDVDTPASIPRIQGHIQIAWKGGDPAVDDPRLTLEKQEDGGDFVPVRSHAGRIITEDYHDFILAWTPDPLFPPDAKQTHYWWATWQAVSHIQDRAGLPEGTYRIKVEGKRYTGQASTWPWDTEDYTFTTTPFEVTAAPIALTQADDGVWASLEAPADGFRLIDIAGDSHGHNPLRGSLTLSWGTTDEPIEQTIEAGDPSGGRTWIARPADTTVTSLTVTDSYGNSGTISLAD